MKCGIIGATGKLGTLLMDESLKRGCDTTAIIRNHKKLIQDAPFIEKDILDLTKDDIKDLDVVISAFGATMDNPGLFDTVTKHLIEVFTGLDTRLIVVGGASSLYTDDTHSHQLIDTDTIPDTLKRFARPMVQALTYYQSSMINWTFFSPSIHFDSKGIYSHDITLGHDVVLYNNKGKSYLSYLDAAQVLIDEVINPQFIKKHFTATSNQY